MIATYVAATALTASPWSLPQARAYLATHEFQLVDRTQSDRPSFDVRFTRRAARDLVRFRNAFRFNGNAHDVFRDIGIHVRFVLSSEGHMAGFRGPPPNRTQPEFPIRTTFYYGWFPEAWDQDHIDPFTVYRPSLGFYDSGDPAVLRTHVAAMRYGRVDAAIYSWWGPGSATDKRFPLALALARQTPLRWAVYYEAEGYGDPSTAQIHSDLLYLKQHYFNQPAYLRVDGKPVVFAYGDGREDCTVAQRWHDANQGIGAYLDLSAFGAREHVSFRPFGAISSAVRVASDSADELVAGTGNEVRMFNRDGRIVETLSTAVDVNSIAAADGAVVVGSRTDGRVLVVGRTTLDTGLQGTRLAAGEGKIVAGAEGGAGLVKVYDAATGEEAAAFSVSPSGPVSVAVAGSRIVTAAGGVVRIVNMDGTPAYPAFRPYAGYTGDVSLAVGDANGDGSSDVITDGDGEPVRIFSLLGPQATQFAEFGAFDPKMAGAVSLAAADTNRNGTDEILAGATSGGEVRLLYGFRDCADQPSSWHVYNPAQPEVYLPPFAFSISPGFARALVRPGDPSLPRDMPRWDQDVSDMKASPLPWHLVETFNEWGEGTAVEGAQEWATPSGYGAYLDALHSAPTRSDRVRAAPR